MSAAAANTPSSQQIADTFHIHELCCDPAESPTVPLVCPWHQPDLPGHADRMWTSNGYVLDESPNRLGELRPVPDAERTDRKRLQARRHRDGYLFLPGALDPAGTIAFRRSYFATLAP